MRILKNPGAKNCHRCGARGKKSRDEAETLYCPKCGIWLEEEEEIPTEPSNESKLASDYSPTLSDWAEAIKKPEPSPDSKPPQTWEELWAKAMKAFPAT